MRPIYAFCTVIFGVQFILSIFSLGASSSNWKNSLVFFLLTLMMAFLFYRNYKNSVTPIAYKLSSTQPLSDTYADEDDTTLISISGESFYQNTLIKIFGEPNEKGHYFETTASLIREPTNKYDSNAIKCLINGKLVGHVNREDAETISANLDANKVTKISVDCEVKGGWNRGKRDAGMYGVSVHVPNKWLD